MPKLIARERFFYAGRNVEAGEEFDAEQQDVGLLTNAVSPRARRPEPRVEEPRQPNPEPEPIVQKVEPTADLSQAAAVEPAKPPQKPARRRYLRRDMRSEG